MSRVLPQDARLRRSGGGLHLAAGAGTRHGRARRRPRDVDLFRELAALHRTRHSTLRHGSDAALSHHTDRLVELEADYLRRFPDREIDPERLRSGARAR
ncbi:DUF6158 family protein [Catellatospora methionotrophica]|uniref:DUF6158 family protein n=1 Tax=Catellatospora methionotrophica TaxID=121620 RepID=UPI0033CEA35C